MNSYKDILVDYHVSILLLCFPIVILLTGCREKCKDEPFPQIGEVMIEAYREPENFDDFVEQNQTIFSERFMTCFEERIEEVKKIADQERDRCNDQWTTGSDFWNQCHNEVEVNYDNSVIIMGDIIKVITDTSSFLNTQTGFYLFFLKTEDPSLYNFTLNLIQDLIDEHPITCKKCESRGFLIF